MGIVSGWVLPCVTNVLVCVYVVTFVVTAWELDIVDCAGVVEIFPYGAREVLCMTGGVTNSLVLIL